MRRVIVACAVFMFGLVLASLTTWKLIQTTDAEETRTITLEMSSFGSARGAANEPCAISAYGRPVERYTLDNFTERIVVTGPSGDILAVSPLVGTTSEGAASGGWLDCDVSLSITVPDAPFYVVSLGDDYLMTVARDELPFADPVPRVIVH